jgi:hypothetical protein
LVDRCGVDGVIGLAFVVPPGDEVGDYVPYLATAPELAGRSGATVVMFDGPATVRYVTAETGSTPSATSDNMVCVIADEIPNAYPDVDREGTRLPPVEYIEIVTRKVCDWTPGYCSADGVPPGAEATP